jgi:hypothetical protein
MITRLFFIFFIFILFYFFDFQSRYSYNTEGCLIQQIQSPGDYLSIQRDYELDTLCNKVSLNVSGPSFEPRIAYSIYDENYQFVTKYALSIS